jgi:hypothetical protein
MAIEDNTRAEINQLKLLARSIVRSQGNIFIRELLREKKLPLGTNKSEFEVNLTDAIDSGALTRADLMNWLEEVEGWGAQHVYVFHIPDVIAADELWTDPNGIRSRLPRDLRRLWNSESANLFPDDRTLTGIYFDGTALRFVWHQRLSSWIREPRHDQKDVKIDGDRYELRAYRDRPDRSVQRFVFRPDLKLAVVFLEIPWTTTAHEQPLAEVRRVTGSVVEWDSLRELLVSDVIKNLDQMEFDSDSSARKVASQRTRLSDGGTYVEFATTSTETGYKDSQAVRSVRKAVKLGDFTGSSGMFLYPTVEPTGKPRPIRLEISSGGRIKLWHQLRATDVWQILVTLRDAETWGTKVRTGRT